jgi:hypothetical protein
MEQTNSAKKKQGINTINAIKVNQDKQRIISG